MSLFLMSAAVVSGQDYPGKPIRITTGSVGGGNDFAARQIAQGISGPLGQPVIVDKQPATAAAGGNRRQAACGRL